jgi:hypothetical protein
MDEFTPQKKDIKTSIALLEQQIDAARVLLDYRPLNNKLYAEWNKETISCLVEIYGKDSPNVRSIETTVGATPLWMGMPPKVAETYQVSRLERTVDMLKSCIVSLRWKVDHPRDD